jgi:hypothetical protein
MRDSLGVVTAMLLAACTLGNVHAMTVGDCFNSDSGVEVGNVDVVDCERPQLLRGLFPA